MNHGRASLTLSWDARPADPLELQRVAAGVRGSEVVVVDSTLVSVLTMVPVAESLKPAPSDPTVEAAGTERAVRDLEMVQAAAHLHAASTARLERHVVDRHALDRGVRLARDVPGTDDVDAVARLDSVRPLRGGGTARRGCTRGPRPSTRASRGSARRRPVRARRVQGDVVDLGVGGQVHPTQ